MWGDAVDEAASLAQMQGVAELSNRTVKNRTRSLAPGCKKSGGVRCATGEKCGEDARRARSPPPHETVEALKARSRGKARQQPLDLRVCCGLHLL